MRNNYEFAFLQSFALSKALKLITGKPTHAPEPVYVTAASRKKGFIGRNFTSAAVLSALLGTMGIQEQTHAQTAIFNASPSAQPGDAVSLQGNFGANAKVFLAPGTSA